MAFDTAANIISDAAIELRLVSAAVADPFASTDPNVLQLVALLKRTGQELLRAHPWSHLTKTHTFSTAATTEDYALPADFSRLVPETAWNRGQQRPMAGPLNAQQWAAEKARSSAGAVGQYFRIFGDRFYIHTTPTAVETVAYEYISRYWVDTGGGATPDAEAPTTAADTVFFDRLLLVASLRAAWLRGNGGDATSATEDAMDAFRMAVGADGGAPVLSARRPTIRSGSPGAWPNVPDTGFGV